MEKYLCHVHLTLSRHSDIRCKWCNQRPREDTYHLRCGASIGPLNVDMLIKRTWTQVASPESVIQKRKSFDIQTFRFHPKSKEKRVNKMYKNLPKAKRGSCKSEIRYIMCAWNKFKCYHVAYFDLFDGRF